MKVENFLTPIALAASPMRQMANAAEIPYLSGRNALLLPGQIARFGYGVFIANGTDQPIRVYVEPLPPQSCDPNCSIGINYNVNSGYAVPDRNWNHENWVKGSNVTLETNPSNRYIFVERNGRNYPIGPQPALSGGFYDNPEWQKINPDFLENRKLYTELTHSEREKYKDLYDRLEQIQ